MGYFRLNLLTINIAYRCCFVLQLYIMDVVWREIRL